MAGRWFSQSTLVSSTNKTDHHDITEILLKVALNPITLTLTLQSNTWFLCKNNPWLVILHNNRYNVKYISTIILIFSLQTIVTFFLLFSITLKIKELRIPYRETLIYIMLLKYHSNKHYMFVVSFVIFKQEVRCYCINKEKKQQTSNFNLDWWSSSFYFAPIKLV